MAADDPKGGPTTAFRLEHRLDVGATESDIVSGWPGGVPDELPDLWRAAREAWLFRDVDYGQWGLHLLDPETAAVRTEQEMLLRPAVLVAGDVVIGEFLGDSEFVVMTADAGILIALPLDARAGWPQAAAGLGEFLATFVRQGGEKYWEALPSPSVEEG